MDRDRRMQILDAAERLFSERGLAGVSMREIAEAADVSKAAIFHHFENKQALYCAVVERACEGTLAMLDELLAEADDDPLARLDRWRRRNLEEMHAHESVVRLILRELTMGEDEQARALADRVFGETFRRLQALVESAQRRGALRRDESAGRQALALAGVNIFLFLVWPVARHLPGRPFDSLEDASGSLHGMLMHGLMAAQAGEVR
ncbi:MAG: helix-turn-helix domain-containing protein [Mariprofundaceae bacterium]